MAWSPAKSFQAQGRILRHNKMAWSPAKSFQAQGRILRHNKPDVFEMKRPASANLHPSLTDRTFFGLSMVDVPPLTFGSGDEKDIQARLDGLRPKAREAYEWAKANCKGRMEIMVNDLPSTIKLVLFDQNDIIVFKTFWT